MVQAEEKAVEEADSDGSCDTSPRKRLKDPAPGYGSGPDYWNKRYRSDPKPFEWLQGFNEIKDLIAEAADHRKDVKILHLGCGTSLLPEDMYEDGYTNIVNIDTSQVAIEQMSERNAKIRPELQWLVMDALHLRFQPEHFDVVIDKSLIDTFACGDFAPSFIHIYLHEVWGVLRPGGVFLCVSYGEPSTRLEYLEDETLNFTIKQVVIPPKAGGGSTHYGYILHKPLRTRPPRPSPKASSAPLAKS